MVLMMLLKMLGAIVEAEVMAGIVVCSVKMTVSSSVGAIGAIGNDIKATMATVSRLIKSPCFFMAILLSSGESEDRRSNS